MDYIQQLLQFLRTRPDPQYSDRWDRLPPSKNVLDLRNQPRPLFLLPSDLWAGLQATGSEIYDQLGLPRSNSQARDPLSQQLGT